MSILKHIKEYKNNPKLLFTTPSHNGGKFTAPEFEKLVGKKYYKTDYSEIDGFDNLAEPKGIIKDALNTASKIYKSESAFFLVNGSSSGIVAAMLATLSRGDKVLIARNCHKSVYNGLVLTGAVPLWIVPEYNEEWGIFETINPDTAEEIIRRNPGIKAFIITTPTYEGVMCDTAKIASICKKYDILLIADEAHGALWNYCRSIGTPAIVEGADISVQSLHKTAGAVNPAAILLTGTNNVSPDKIQQALNLINTTSPSYPLLANIEATINYLNTKKGKAKIYELLTNIARFTRTVKETANIDIYENNNDVTKILIKISNMTGFQLSEILYDKYDIECEIANEKACLFLTGMGTTKTALNKLKKALIEIASDNIKITDDSENLKTPPTVQPRVRYTPAAIWGKPSKEADIRFSVSRVAMEVIANYPPGIPIILPGEVIRKEHIDYLSDRKKIKVLM